MPTSTSHLMWYPGHEFLLPDIVRADGSHLYDSRGKKYVDLESDIAGEIPRFGPTKRIVSYHSFRNTPENLRELHSQLAALDADVVKISTMANSPHDNLRILEMMDDVVDLLASLDYPDGMTGGLRRTTDVSRSLWSAWGFPCRSGDE